MWTNTLVGFVCLWLVFGGLFQLDAAKYTASLSSIDSNKAAMAGEPSSSNQPDLSNAPSVAKVSTGINISTDQTSSPQSNNSILSTNLASNENSNDTPISSVPQANSLAFGLTASSFARNLLAAASRHTNNVANSSTNNIANGNSNNVNPSINTSAGTNSSVNLKNSSPSSPANLSLGSGNLASINAAPLADGPNYCPAPIN